MSVCIVVSCCVYLLSNKTCIRVLCVSHWLNKYDWLNHIKRVNWLINGHCMYTNPPNFIFIEQNSDTLWICESLVFVLLGVKLLCCRLDQDSLGKRDFESQRDYPWKIKVELKIKLIYMVMFMWENWERDMWCLCVVEREMLCEASWWLMIICRAAGIFEDTSSLSRNALEST